MKDKVEFMEEFRRMYISDDIYNLEYYSDIHVFDYVRTKFEHEFNIETKNLSNIGNINEEAPMANSIMHDYFDHLIGPGSKKSDHSVWWEEERKRREHENCSCYLT